MHAERIDHLITVLERVRDAHKPFNMSRWFTVNHCRTASCAVGHACLDPEFQRQGLEISRLDDNAHINFWSQPCYKGYLGMYAASGFFQIPIAAAWWIFDPSQYPSHPVVYPQMVIDRLVGLRDKGISVPIGSPGWALNTVNPDEIAPEDGIP